jgi:hypothetical protein
LSLFDPVYEHPAVVEETLDHPVTAISQVFKLGQIFILQK